MKFSISIPDLSESDIGDSLASTIESVNMLFEEISAINRDDEYFNDKDPEIEENRKILLSELISIKKNLKDDFNDFKDLIGKIDKMINIAKKSKYSKKRKSKSPKKKRSKSPKKKRKSSKKMDDFDFF